MLPFVVLYIIPRRSFIRYQNLFPIKELSRLKGSLSERSLAKLGDISRVGLRKLLTNDQNVTVKSFVKMAKLFDRDIHVLAIDKNTLTEFSTVAVSYKVIRDGEGSWKIHFMELVDEFRRTLDPQLLLLPPVHDLPIKEKALLASIVLSLCEESHISVPLWCHKDYFLDRPWFVSGIHSLKASAILESPLAFRRNNIFVLKNFLGRV